MKFTTEKIEWTDSMKNFCETETKKKLKSLIKDLDETQFKVNKVNNVLFKVDINLDCYRVQSIKEDFYEAAGEAILKLKSIITKDKKRTPLPNPGNEIMELNYDDLLSNLNISKEKVFVLKPESLDEALVKFEKTDYNFYVFKDIDYNGQYVILYKRYDNTYGLIRCC